MTTAQAEQKMADLMEQTARVYLEDVLYDVLLGHDEPVKTRDIVAAVKVAGANQRVIKEVLSSSNRFDQVERRWNLAARTVDTQRPMQKIIAQVMDACGRPMTLAEMAHEMSLIYERPAEHFEEMLPRLLSNSEYYFATGEDMYGRADWLLVTSSDDEGDVMFDSFIEKEELSPYTSHAAKAKWVPDEPLTGALDFLKKAKAPVFGRILQFFAWRADPISFDAAEFYTALAHSDDFLLLYGQRVADGGIREDLGAQLNDLGKRLEEMPSEGEEEQAEGPVEVTEADVDEIVRMILAEQGPARAEDLLDTVLEVAPGEKAYQGALQSLIETLRNEPRVQWVGDGRWRTPEAIPEYINEVPASLAIPVYSFVTPEGEVLDQELEDEGLDSGLRSDIMNPVVMDIGDEDPLDKKHAQPLGDRQKCVVKYQYKEAGTFPLCQINPEFFGTEPAIINVTLVDEGVRREMWLNRGTRLIYDMKDWYKTEMPVSGAVFYVEKTQKPDEFRFVYTGETDDRLFVQPARLLELLELKEKAESQEMPTTDIIITIMERYKQGIEFAPLFTEVNLVRRCSRRLVASILSSYHAFYRKENVWRYDSEKWSKGFNKTKRKHIKKA
ncbi:MAG: hypothetical protein Q7T82_04420 [Armatimonadota bacterium]|nr:hypothetical protein [Armatimonadota bacterium]